MSVDLKNPSLVGYKDLYLGCDSKECTNQQRRSFWNRAKRRLYDAQALLYANTQNQTQPETQKS